MSQPEAISPETATEAEAAVKAPQTPTAQPHLTPAGPTLQTTEKLLAEHIGKHLSKDLSPEGLTLNLAVHLHDGKENLNLTFSTPSGFGLNALQFNEAIQKIVKDIPSFGTRLEASDVATLTDAETPKDQPNALRLVMKFTSPQLAQIAQELHGLAPAPAPVAKDITPEIVADAAAIAEAPKKPGHPQPSETAQASANDNPATATEAAEAASAEFKGPDALSQPSAPPASVNDNPAALPDNTITTPAAEHARVEEHTKQVA